jgi:hypothetical protein
MGRRAGIEDAHPHRFRDTFAVDMLARGATPYDVAKLLGDEISTYRDRVRTLMETGERLHQYSGAETKVNQPQYNKSIGSVYSAAIFSRLDSRVVIRAWLAGSGGR